MDHEIACEEGICYIATSFPYNYILCGSIVNSWYKQLPSTWIALSRKQFGGAIIPLKGASLDDECRVKLEIISEQSFCLRAYRFDPEFECEDNYIPFKNTPNNLLKLIRAVKQPSSVL